jgi:diguanylate cyclase (GGDEF)-like protein
LIADLDHFKSVNDTYGHLTGDAVLREVTRRMVGDVRSYDAVGRYGGEEFLILLPNCNGAETEEKAERLRRVIVQEPIETESGQLKITVSIGGVATCSWPQNTASQILQMADSALYRAKEDGRNRTVMAGIAENEEVHGPSLETSSMNSQKK